MEQKVEKMKQIVAIVSRPIDLIADSPSFLTSDLLSFCLFPG